MEWKTKPIPKNGQYRERLIFAFVPRDCVDGKTRWMCKVRVLEEYREAVWTTARAGWHEIKAYRAEFEVLKKRNATKEQSA